MAKHPESNDERQLKQILFAALTLLVAADCTITYIGVGHFGAIETNSLYYQLGGLIPFMLLKIAASAVALGLLACIGKHLPRVVTVLLGGLCIYYSWVFITNLRVIQHG